MPDKFFMGLGKTHLWKSEIDIVFLMFKFVPTNRGFGVEDRKQRGSPQSVSREDRKSTLLYRGRLSRHLLG